MRRARINNMQKSLIALAALLFAVTASAATINNDDSCDVATFPAATLLLPYFEVDFNAPQTIARTTLFTVYNVTRLPQIARVTLWTDWAYPVLSFDIFLTGYDVQAINLYDILGPRGVVGSAAGTTNLTDVGSRSLFNDENPNLLPAAGTACQILPGAIPAPVLADVRTAFTTGIVSGCSTSRVGSVHPNAVGYATIDLVATCSAKLPTDAGYFNELLYDNVLGGDYQWINPNPATGNYAGGNPLVHIRAIPEGGAAGTAVATSLPYTFYDRYTAVGGQAPSPVVRTMDRRQPLPARFAVRYIQGGSGAFNTDLRIWREGIVGKSAGCSYAANNGTGMVIIELTRFDEHENPLSLSSGIPERPPYESVVLPPTSSTSTSSGLYPAMSSIAGDVAGWLYMNLSNLGSPNYSGTRASQSWPVISMSAEGRYQVAFDALTLANGCSPSISRTNFNNPIGPGENTNP